MLGMEGLGKEITVYRQIMHSKIMDYRSTGKLMGGVLSLKYSLTYFLAMKGS